METVTECLAKAFAVAGSTEVSGAKLRLPLPAWIDWQSVSSLQKCARAQWNRDIRGRCALSFRPVYPSS
jgi:hypothetical protein